MTTVTNIFQIQINAKPDVVFAYVADIPRHSEWNAGLRVEAMSAGPVAVGSAYRSRGAVLNQTDRPNELRVTGYEPPNLLAFVAQDPDFKEVKHEFTFKPQGTSTLLERTVISNLPAPMAFIFRILIFPLVGKPAGDKSLAALKAKLEQGV